MTVRTTAEISRDRIKTFRWYYYLGLLQVILFFLIPTLGFPMSHLPGILTIAALTLGLLFAVFFLMVNLLGLVMDRGRRPVYIVSGSLMVLWLIWAAVSWTYIEHMDYLLHL